MTSNRVWSPRTRCTALVGVHPAERRLRAGVEGDAGVARAGPGPRRGRPRGRRTARRCRRARRRARRSRSSDVSAASSLRYSSASRPTMLAFRRSGRSLVTTVTSWPSLAQVVGDGEDAVVVVVGGHRAAAGRRVDWWLSSTRSVPPWSLTGSGMVSEPCSRRSRSRCRSALAGGPAQLGVVALRLQLHQHHDREHHLVLVEAHQRPRVGEQHRRVEHVGAGARRNRSRRLVGHGSPKRDGSHQVRAADDVRLGTAAWRVTAIHLTASSGRMGGPSAIVHLPVTGGSQVRRERFVGPFDRPRIVAPRRVLASVSPGEGE